MSSTANIRTIGIAGGGQLGLMLCEAAHALGLRVVILDPAADCPASRIADDLIVGDFKDADMLVALSKKCDVLTYEIESVNAEALKKIAETMPVHPTPHSLSIIKDKLAQKQFLRERNIPVAPFAPFDLSTKADVAAALGYPFVLKARFGGFDGRGNAMIEREADIEAAFAQLGAAECYAEGFVRFDKELAVVAARTTGGEIAVFPLVETIQKNHICHEVLAPAPVAGAVASKAHALTERVLAAFDGAGVFGVELFLVGSEVMVNEIAPRVHNSGHFTIEGCHTSQFEQHIRAITGMALGDASMRADAAVMVNILGDRTGNAEPHGVKEAESIGNVRVHMYGKLEARPERKMGHLTAIGESLQEAKDTAERARTLISI